MAKVCIETEFTVDGEPRELSPQNEHSLSIARRRRD
jgi:hypothetical protein